MIDRTTIWLTDVYSKSSTVNHDGYDFLLEDPTWYQVSADELWDKMLRLPLKGDADRTRVQ